MKSIVIPAWLAAAIVCAPLAQAESGDQSAAQEAVTAIYKPGAGALHAEYATELARVPLAPGIDVIAVAVQQNRIVVIPVVDGVTVVGSGQIVEIYLCHDRELSCGP